jgi:hypothetical protein
MAEELKKAGAAKVKPAGAKPGSYNAVFTGAYELPPREDGPDYGPALICKWKSDCGAEPSAIVSQTPTVKNACGRILAGMLGRQLRTEEEVSWEQFEGKRYMVLVVTNKAGTGTTVAEVSPL